MTHKKNLPKETAFRLQQLEERFKIRLEDIYKTIENLKADTDCHKSLDKLISISHKLAGSSGTFGFPQLSIDMKNYEHNLIKIKIKQQLISQKDIILLCDRALLILNNTIKH